ncbi:protein mono-ADP-ribosyltransferase PARP14-like [Alosa alosa]|uniref:protein mono-ADP-ribosyltransferase PARP14-like n=1 Tax=Alosa alosa TaxID=278164 RepID=UPI0020150AA0|nr:protein mono-ADP-ribosyltransferase PARP14-like [Alosa alosa]
MEAFQVLTVYLKLKIPRVKDPVHHVVLKFRKRRLKICKPNVVVVENISEDMTKDVLGLIVENISAVSEDEYTMELIYESHAAVVTFIHPDNVETFLTEAKLSKKFQQYGLTAQLLERPCSLRMEGLPPQADKDLLHLYYVITMLRKQHTICKVEISMYPYYESLGTALYGKDRPRWKIPGSFRVPANEATDITPSDKTEV